MDYWEAVVLFFLSGPATRPQPARVAMLTLKEQTYLRMCVAYCNNDSWARGFIVAESMIGLVPNPFLRYVCQLQAWKSHLNKSLQSVHQRCWWQYLLSPQSISAETYTILHATWKEHAQKISSIQFDFEGITINFEIGLCTAQLRSFGTQDHTSTRLFNFIGVSSVCIQR